MTHTDDSENTAPLKPEALDRRALDAASRAGDDAYMASGENAVHDAIVAGIRAYLAASPAPQEQGVRVKALEWRKNPLGNWVAQSLVGQYFVFREDGVWCWVVVDISAWRNFASEDAAKADAQSDYERRILSALAIQEPASEPVAWDVCLEDGTVTQNHRNEAHARASADYFNANGDKRIVKALYYAPPPAPAVPADLVQRLNDRASSYRSGGPSSEHTAAILDEAASAIASLTAERDEVVRERDEKIARALNQADVEAERAGNALNDKEAAEAALARALEERDKLRADLAFADRQSASVEALLETHVKWEPGTIRVCPLRDAACPHGLACPYTDGYDCKPGWNSTLQSQRPE